MKKFRKIASILMLATAVIFAAGCTKPDEPNNGGNNNGGGNNGGGNNGGGTYNGHEYVDLDLPSGTLWAVDDMSGLRDENAKYYAWGETAIKTEYDWNTYQYGHGWNEMTKYCTNAEDGYNGFVDNLTVLQTSDDAVAANWGEGWRMPTIDEWVELFENTEYTWTTQDNVAGVLLTASNGSKMFLPAAGMMNGSSSNAFATTGYYWSSSLGDGSSYAFGMAFDESTYHKHSFGRFGGFSVRAVRSTDNGGGGNGSGETPAELPQVSTAEVSNITSTTAICSGSILSNGGGTITECGVCWSTSETPTIDGNHAITQVTSGTFTVNVQNLAPNTVYYVRAYAKNEAGIAYGTALSFTTLYDGPAAPEGAIRGKFTVNSGGKQVYFSKGNLQYQASTSIWRFAEQQWNYVGGSDCYGIHYGNVEGSTNSLVSPTYNGWIDYFGFGTSGWDNGNLYYHPYDIGSESTSWQGEICFGFGPMTDLTGSYANADWGVYNAISNGGNRPGLWRTLSNREWEYVLNERNGSRFAFAKVNEVYGFLLLPDDWNTSTYNLNYINSVEAPLDANVISLAVWATLEAQGVVFLPCGGWSNYSTESAYQVEVKCPGTGAMYWSSSYWNNPDSDWGQPYIVEGSYGGSLGVFTDVGSYLCQVRLVQEVE